MPKAAQQVYTITLEFFVFALYPNESRPSFRYSQNNLTAPNATKDNQPNSARHGGSANQPATHPNSFLHRAACWKTAHAGNEAGLSSSHPSTSDASDLVNRELIRVNSGCCCQATNGLFGCIHGGRAARAGLPPLPCPALLRAGHT